MNLRDNNSIQKRAYAWTLLVSVINALEAVVILMVAMRTVSLQDTGIMTFGFVVANLLSTVGRYEVRPFQVTDATNEHAFSAYLRLRKVTFGTMMLLSVMFCVTGTFLWGYTIEKCLIIFGIVLMHSSEVIEDVYSADYQKGGRLDISSMIAFWRWTLSIAVVSILLILTKKSVISIWGGAISSWICMIVFVSIYNKKLGLNKTTSVEQSQIAQLIKKCFPIFATSFLTFYITNAAKYAIDSCMDDNVQANYGFVAMPVYAIATINHVIFQPRLVQMADLYSQQKYKEFNQIIRRQLVIIMGLTALCIGGAYVLGIPVLELVYNAELKDYKFEMIILLLGGGFAAVSTFFANVYTVIRRQIITMYINVGVFVLAIVFTSRCVSIYGTWGAALINAVWLIATAILNLVGYYFICKKN